MKKIKNSDHKHYRVLVTPTSFGMDDPGLESILESMVGEVVYNPTSHPLASAELCSLVQDVDGYIAGLHHIDAAVIRVALDEVYQGIGIISDLCQAADLTIFHTTTTTTTTTTSKKLNHTSNHTYGGYRRLSKTIIVGVKRGCGRIRIDGLAHELTGRQLDAVSVPPQGWLSKMLPTNTTITKSSQHRLWMPAVQVMIHSTRF